MADHEMAGVIVSGNRYDDLEPYMGRIYKAEPQIWGSIFPWEFPQNAGREDEESFLRGFFSEAECHMQGFRFLKQAWYCIALRNLNTRVPAVADWWWEQEDRKAYLDDDELKKWFFKPDVEPSTFFSASEMEMYGNKFLSFVIPRIQQTAKTILEQQEAEKQASDAGSNTTPADTVSDEPSLPMIAKEPSSAEHDVPATEAKASQDARVNAIPPSSAVMSHSSPVPFTHELARPRVTSNDHQFTQEFQFHPRKRGNSAGRRFSNRGSGHFQGRQPYSNGRVPQHFSPTTYQPSAQVFYAIPGRMSSRGELNFMPTGSQGQQVPGMPPHGAYVPHSFEHNPPMQHPAMNQQMPYAHGQPHPNFTPHPFTDRTNLPSANRVFSSESNFSSIDDHYQNRTGNRRNSQSSRRGKSRGYGTDRGRWSRGRNSFGASDQPLFASYDQNFNRYFSNESADMEYGPMRRRESIVSERNWRSGRDHPQAQQDDHPQKENVHSGREFAGYGEQPMPFAPRPSYHNSVGQPYKRKAEQADFLRYNPDEAFSPPMHLQTPKKPGHLQPSTPQDLSPEKSCGRNHIGAKCTYAIKLVVFNVPAKLTAEQIQGFFNQFAQVASVNVRPEVYYERQLVRLYFKNPVQARQCLLNKPARWLDGEELRVEVAKEYWDPMHKNYCPPSYHNLGPEASAQATYDSPALVVFHRSADTTPTPRGHRLEEAAGDREGSRDTTPTPSGASTPKKGKNKNKNKRNMSGYKKNRERELLRTSLEPVSEKENAHSDTASVVTAVNLRQGAKGEVPTGAGESLMVDTSALQKDGAGLDQKEKQTASKSSFTTTDDLEAWLPPPLRETEATDPQDALEETDIQDSPKDAKSSSPEQTETHASSEPTLLPKDKVEIQLPAKTQGNSEPFRKDEKAEDKAQGTSAGGSEESGEPVKEAETPSKSDEERLDDSFHTASGSPDSDKSTGDRDNISSGEAKAVSSTSLKEESSSSQPGPGINDAAQANAGVIPASSTPVSLTSVSSTPAPPEKDSKKVHVTQLPSKPTVATAPSALEKKSDTSGTKQRSISGAGAVPPTPAFSTAPNTPFVPQEIQKSYEVAMSLPSSKKIEKAEKIEEPEKIEKAEKSKGPAQTESLSLFGKKREKKPKPAKKGTVKGRPKTDGSYGSEVTSESTSRVASGAATPVPEPYFQTAMGPPDVRTGDEDTSRSDSKILETSENELKVEAKSETNTAEEVARTSLSQQVTPSKARGTLSHIFSGLFGAGQPSASNDARSDEAVSSNPSLTDTKAQPRPQETTTKPLSSTCGETDSAGKSSECAGCEPKPEVSGAEVRETQESDITSETGSLAPEAEDGAEVEVGLGISNAAAESIAGGDPKPKKEHNNKRKGKRGKHKSDVGSVDISEEASPAPRPPARPEIFRFTAGETPSPTHNRDDRSDASSYTLGRDTPTSDGQSAVVSTSGRKLPTKSADAGHLVVGKSPTWKQKKRVASPKTSENTTAIVDEQGNIIYYLEENDGSETSAQDSVSGRLVDSPPVGNGQPKRLFVYIGHGKRDDAERVQVEDSRKKMADLACEEAKRKLEIGGQGTTGGELWTLFHVACAMIDLSTASASSVSTSSD